LGLEHAYLDAMYICPHHPDKGYEGEIPELKINCSCRKPLPGLIHQGILDFDVNPRNSWMVGDATSDILAGKRAGLRTILVRTGYAGRDNKFDVNPDYICEDLLGAVNWIQKGYSNVRMKLMPIIHDVFRERSILIGGVSRSGKSTVAQVAKEMMEELGRTAHIISLDSWLKPQDQRLEGVGVLERYDISESLKVLQTVINSNNRMSVEVPFWDRKTSQKMKPRRISIGPDDFLIVEGVPALLDARFEKLINNSLFISVDDIIQRQRVKQEYMWRGMNLDDIQNLIASRELDEVSKIKVRGVFAKYQLNLGSI
jgi:uridine kinase